MCVNNHLHVQLNKNALLHRHKSLGVINKKLSVSSLIKPIGHTAAMDIVLKCFFLVGLNGIRTVLEANS